MDELIVEREDSILDLLLNRPAKLNAFDHAMYTAFAEALDRAQQDDDVHVVLVHGAGRSFSAGNDLEDFENHPSELGPQTRFIEALLAFDKPIVAAIHGLAVGVGTTMLAHVDFVYAGESASFLAPFVNLGLVPEMGSSYLLPAQLGYHAAAELLMWARPMGAARAAEVGLVTAVVPDAELMKVAAETAQELSSKPPGALRACKRLLRAHAVAHTEAVWREEAKEFGARLQSDDTKQAVRAFFQKRQGARARGRLSPQRRVER